MALLPVLARETTGGALAYGLLLGSLGFGAVSAAAFLDRIRARWSSDAIVTAGSIVFGVVCMAIGATRNLWILAPIFFIGGTAWISVLSTLNISAQRVSPSWVRARALAVYLLVLQAGIMGGSAAWGAVAKRMDLATAYLAAGGALVLGSFLLSGVRLARGETEDLTPTHHWPDPAQIDVSPETGPVVIEVEYRIDPARAQDFVRAARELRRIRRRDGAVQWWLLRDTDEPARWVEIFAVETWGEHLRQHERVSAADRAVEDTVFAFHLGPERPKARHLLSTPLERGVTPGKFTREA